MKTVFVLKYKLEDLYLGKVDNKFIFTTSDSRHTLRFSNESKAVKTIRSANMQQKGINKLFDIVTLNTNNI